MAIEPEDIRERMGLGAYDFVISENDRLHFARNEMIGSTAIHFLTQIALRGTRHYAEVKHEVADQPYETRALIAPWDTSIERAQVNYHIPHHNQTITRVMATSVRRTDTLMTCHDFFIAYDQPMLVWRRQTIPVVKNTKGRHWPCGRNDIPKLIRINESSDESVALDVHVGSEYERRHGHRSQASILESARELGRLMNLFTASSTLPIREVAYISHANKGGK